MHTTVGCYKGEQGTVATLKRSDYIIMTTLQHPSRSVVGAWLGCIIVSAWLGDEERIVGFNALDGMRNSCEGCGNKGEALDLLLNLSLHITGPLVPSV